MLKLSVTAIAMAGDPQYVCGAVTLEAPAEGNADGTRCQRRAALGLTTAEKIGKIRSEGEFVS